MSIVVKVTTNYSNLRLKVQTYGSGHNTVVYLLLGKNFLFNTHAQLSRGAKTINNESTPTELPS